MDEKKCPFCGSKLYKSSISDKYVCEKMGCSGVFELDSPLLLISPTYREEKMFKVKPYGKISFFVDRDKLKFVIRAGSKDYGAYDISQLIEFSVSDNSQTIYQSRKGTVPMIAGGFLFGSVGAVAGSVAASTKTKEITKHKYELTFVIDDKDFVGFTGETKDKNVALRVAKQIEAMRKDVAKRDGEKTVSEVSKPEVKPDTNEIDDYRKAKEEMKRLGFKDYDEYLDYLEFKKKKQQRNI